MPLRHRTIQYTGALMNRPARILITRPCGQHREFAASLQVLGLSVAHLPCLAICSNLDQWPETDPLIGCDSVLFTSVNAVHQAQRLRPLPWPGLAVFAIGKATASALHEAGQGLALSPMAPFNSEALLQQLQTREPGRLCLIKGLGGRGLLTPALQSRGWQVRQLDVYRRELPRIESRDIEQLLRCPAPDIISITSNEILHNLVTLAAEHLPTLIGLPLVVNSERAATAARELGFHGPTFIAEAAGDQGQLACIRQWLQTRDRLSER